MTSTRLASRQRQGTEGDQQLSACLALHISVPVSDGIVRSESCDGYSVTQLSELDLASFRHFETDPRTAQARAVNISEAPTSDVIVIWVPVLPPVGGRFSLFHIEFLSHEFLPNMRAWLTPQPKWNEPRAQLHQGLGETTATHYGRGMECFSVQLGADVMGAHFLIDQCHGRSAGGAGYSTGFMSGPIGPVCGLQVRREAASSIQRPLLWRNTATTPPAR